MSALPAAATAEPPGASHGDASDFLDDGRMEITVWRSEDAPYLAVWRDAVENLARHLPAYFGSMDGWSDVTFAWEYRADGGVSIDEYSGDGLAAALPDDAVGAGRVNVVITDHDGWANLGACHYRDFYGRENDHGVLAHQNVTLPQSNGLVALPDRYVEPNVVHEMLHGLTPYGGHVDHQFGRQDVREVETDDGETRTVLEPTCLATGYSTAWQSADTSDWTDCEGRDWRTAQLWNCAPRTEISACADLAVRFYLGDAPADADGFSWNRPYLE